MHIFHVASLLHKSMSWKNFEDDAANRRPFLLCILLSVLNSVVLHAILLFDFKLIMLSEREFIRFRMGESETSEKKRGY